MSALTQDRETARKDFLLKSVPVAASTVIYKGSLVAINSSGYAVPAADSASLRVIGVAYEKADNSAGANAAIDVRVQTAGIYKFAASSITQAMVGKIMYVVDDQTVDDAVGTNGIKAGRLVEFVATTEGWIEVIPASVGITTADGSDAATTQALANAIKAALNSYFA